jgi:uncharacterized repeat protein (TIGR01451 family)
VITSSYFYAYCNHTYTATGNYNLQYIATGPDGNADTVYGEVLVGDTCGNISGNVYVDMNGDCIFNSGDVLHQYTTVVLLHNNQIINWTVTDSLGNYYFNVPLGNNYTIQVGSQINYYGYTVSCPAAGEYAVNAVPSANNDFGLQCLGGFDLQGSLSGWGFRPGFGATIYPGLSNNYCLPVSGQAKLVIDDPLLSYVSATIPPDQLIGDTLIWNFSNLTNQSFWNWYSNSLGSVHVMTSLNAAIGDTVCVTLIVIPVMGDENPANNTVTTCWAVRNSWDPNEKEVSPRGVTSHGNVLPNTEFTYTIHFQNMGNDTAYNIFILDTLDADINISTYHPVASSHPMEADILTGRILRFTFNNIMLADSSTNEPLSHGWVTYKVTAGSGLLDGTEITNSAGIYFDFNPAVMTNTTLNTIESGVGISDVPSGNAMQLIVYPNPAKSGLHFQSGIELKNAELKVVNHMGQIMKTLTGINGNTGNINCSELSNGLYILVMKSDNTQTAVKFVISR